MPTQIEWCDETWNPVTGCTRVSPGCANCYIERTPPFRMAGRRFDRVGNEETTGVILHPERLDQPLRWRKPRRVFVCSLADLFHEAVPRDHIHDVFRTMERADRHTFQVLTKRPERALDVLRWLYTCTWCDGDGCVACAEHDAPRGMKSPLPNVWVGVSIENARYTWRADVLRQIPAAVLFVSAEPLLSSLFDSDDLKLCPECETPLYLGHDPECSGPVVRFRDSLDLAGLNWLICGGESGPGARPMHPEWARELRDACQTTSTAFFMKQMGSVWARENGADSKGGKIDYWPADLRVREMPA